MIIILILHMYSHSLHPQRLLLRGRGYHMGNNVGPPAAAIEGDVRRLQHC